MSSTRVPIARHVARRTAITTLAVSLAMVAVASLPAGAKKITDPYLKADLHAPSASLVGAGSTFDEPYFTKAFYDFSKADPGVTVTYSAVGSGTGVQDFQADLVNFGASDVPMSPAQTAATHGGEVLQVPIDLGGVALAYNLPGIKSGLKLTPAVLAAIYLGKITKWNAPAIKKLNPKLNLPSAGITTVHRADSSGTSYIFTNYLSSISPKWAAGPGTAKTVAWPVGIGGTGTAGVAAAIANTKDSIGYIELAYALQSDLTYASLENAAGKFVEPSKTTVAAAAADKPDITSVNFSIVDQPGKNSYPICGYSWALIYQLQKNLTTGTALVKMLDWMSHEAGQKIAGTLDYVPLPANVQALARATLLQVTGPDGATVLLTK